MLVRVISDLDIYRAANLRIERHGRDAVVEAGRLLDLMLDRGDMPFRSHDAIVKAETWRGGSLFCHAIGKELRPMASVAYVPASARRGSSATRGIRRVRM